jgi:hypothetical protein
MIRALHETSGDSIAGVAVIGLRRNHIYAASSGRVVERFHRA